jgi:hypothetical protein
MYLHFCDLLMVWFHPFGHHWHIPFANLDVGLLLCLFPWELAVPSSISYLLVKPLANLPSSSSLEGHHKKCSCILCDLLIVWFHPFGYRRHIPFTDLDLGLPFAFSLENWLSLHQSPACWSGLWPTCHFSIVEPIASWLLDCYLAISLHLAFVQRTPFFFCHFTLWLDILDLFGLFSKLLSHFVLWILSLVLSHFMT